MRFSASGAPLPHWLDQCRISAGFPLAREAGFFYRIGFGGRRASGSRCLSGPRYFLAIAGALPYKLPMLKTTLALFLLALSFTASAAPAPSVICSPGFLREFIDQRPKPSDSCRYRCYFQPGRACDLLAGSSCATFVPTHWDYRGGSSGVMQSDTADMVCKVAKGRQVKAPAPPQVSPRVCRNFYTRAGVCTEQESVCGCSTLILQCSCP
jgi:hypothetical protein